MDPQLQQALDALQQAHIAGNEEDARQIAEYIKLLQTQQENKAMLESGEESMMENPIAAGAVGAIAGPVAGKVLETAYGPKGVQPPPVPTTTPGMAGAPGQKYAAKTGYGAGSGETVREVVEEFKKQEGPLGKGKVTSKIKGGPLGGPAAMEQIAAKEADAARFAQMRAANQMAAQKAGSIPSRVAQATAGKMPLLMKSAAGAGAGLQASDAYNRMQQGDYLGAGLGALGAAGSAASLIPHPITRIGGTAIGIGAGALNAYIDYLKSKAQPQQPVQQPQAMKAGGLAKKAKGAAKKMSEVLVPHEGKTLLATMADRTKATEGFSGGPGFINLHPEYTWAVDAPGAATRHMRMIEAAGGPERTVVAPMLMSKEAHKSNRPVFEKMYKDLLEDIRSGKVTPEQIAALQKRLSVEKTLQGVPNIDDKEFLEFANAFHRRGTIADIMGQKRIGAVDLQKHLDETIDPALRESKLGAIGPQLFTMESQQLKPDVHPGYRYVFSGEKGEDQFTPVPREFLFRDLESKAMKELGRPLSDYNYRTSVGIPTQLIDEKLLRQLQEMGYAKGGRIAKATRDLILPPAENAARTQIIGTLPTYAKAAEILKQRGAAGRGIDVGAGLGEGSKILGKNFDTMEPYAKNWKPTYTSAEDMPSDAYGQLTNLNVLNVMPREARDELVQHIGRTMEPGGLGILTTRGADVMKAQGRPGPEEMSMITSRDTYQKGFTKQELEDYLRYILGEKFDVNKLNLGPAGAVIQKKAEGGEVFDPEGSGYDYKTALAYGMGPDGKGEDLGHWGSVAPTSDDERMLRDLPRDTYVMLKGKAHETFKKAEKAEKKRGSKTVKSGERYYSVPEYAKGGSTTPAWQRAEGKNPEGGLNAKGRASYNRETGGNLKAPQPEGGSRKKSFCARMGGMKKKLTSSKTANDPDSRINKALRKWKC